MKVPPLTAAEKAWLKKAQALFDEVPRRFNFITIGDPYLSVVDGPAARKIEIHDGRAERAGIVLASIDTKVPVHATTG